MLSTIFINLPYVLLFFAREIGLFFLSPLFVQRGVPLILRAGLVLIVSLIVFPQFSMPLDFSWLLVLKEIAVGYLLGTVFAFILEGALAAGRWFCALAGFSTTELLDPTQNQKNPLFVTFFALLTIAFIFASDLHHLFLYSFVDSYNLIPVQLTEIKRESLFSLSQASQFFFSQGLSYILYPLFFLLALLLFMALLSKFYPEIPIFWIGLPIQLFFGFLGLSIMMIFMVPLIQKAFIEILHLVTALNFN